jgi:hypothetical protein
METSQLTSSNNKIIYADADGSHESDGSFEQPYTIRQAVATGEKVIVVLDSGGTIIVNNLQISDSQQLLGAGDDGQISISFHDGTTQTITGLGARPVIRNDISGPTLILSDNSRVEGLGFESTTVEIDEPVMTGTSVTNIALDDLIISADYNALELSDVTDLSISSIAFSTGNNAIALDGCRGQVRISEISSSSTASGAISIHNNREDLSLSDISLIGGTEGGLNIFSNQGNVTIDNVQTSSNTRGIELTGYTGSTFNIRNLDMNGSHTALSIGGASEVLIEDSIFKDSLSAINIQYTEGQITLNNIDIDNRLSARAGGVGITATDSSSELVIHNVDIVGEIHSGVRLSGNRGAVNIDNLGVSNTTSVGVQIHDNQGTILANNMELVNGSGNAVEISSDQSIDAIQISNSRIDQYIYNGIELTYCEGRYILDNVTMSNIDGLEVHLNYSPLATVIQN